MRVENVQFRSTFSHNIVCVIVVFLIVLEYLLKRIGALIMYFLCLIKCLLAKLNKYKTKASQSMLENAFTLILILTTK